MLGLNQMSLTGGRILGPGDDAVLNLNFLSGSLDPRITFTRASTATRYNSSGLLETVSSGTPRFDYDPVTLAPKGLLIEESRTNLLTYSADLTNAAWNKTDVTVAQTGATAPDGGSSSRITAGTGSGLNSRVFAYNTATSTCAVSFYYKAGTAPFLHVRVEGGGNWGRCINTSTGALTTGYYDGTSASTAPTNARVIGVGNGWYRCELVVPTTVAGFVFFYPSSSATRSDGTGGTLAGETIDIWGVQVEVGSFATSYIPTTTSAVTRAAETPSLTGTNFSSWYNQSEGTFVAEFQAKGYLAGSVARVLGFDLANGATPMFLASATEIANWNGGQAIVAPVSSSVLNFCKGALGYTDNVSRSMVADGGTVVTSSTDYNTGTPTVLYIGHNFTGDQLNGHIARIRYYNTRKTNAQLQSLTA